MVTVFTPSYNRAHTIEKVYESLKRQTFKDFEWLIIDDGSKDETKKVVDRFISEEPFFEIVYVYKENGGKHTAMNLAGDIARGEVLVICDSDDWLADNALERVMHWYDTIKDNEKIAGVVGRCAVENREQFFKDAQTDFEFLDIPFFRKRHNGIFGEDTFGFKTEIFKKYKFPEIKEERYQAEGIQLNLMTLDGYVFRFVNEIYKYGAYLEDGLTYDYKKVNHDNPRGYALWRILEARQFSTKKRHLAFIYNDYRAEMHYRYTDKEIAKFLGISYIYLKFIVISYNVRKKIKQLF